MCLLSISRRCSIKCCLGWTTFRLVRPGTLRTRTRPLWTATPQPACVVSTRETWSYTKRRRGIGLQGTASSARQRARPRLFVGGALARLRVSLGRPPEPQTTRLSSVAHRAPSTVGGGALPSGRQHVAAGRTTYFLLGLKLRPPRFFGGVRVLPLELRAHPDSHRTPASRCQYRSAAGAARSAAFVQEGLYRVQAVLYPLRLTGPGSELGWIACSRSPDRLFTVP